MQFTVDNLLDNLDKLGPWSAYGLASEALQYYFPNEYDENDLCPIMRECELLYKMGFKTWGGLITKYHEEVGYDRPDGLFDKGSVNKY